MNLKQGQEHIVNDAIIRAIIETLNSLKYGHVQITVHNSKVVQIDKTEKTRFDDVRSVDGSISFTINPKA